MAREVAQSMLNDKVAELEEAQKQQPKEGKSVAEKIAARKEHKANIERIEKEIGQWQQILSQSEQQPTTEETKPKEETPSNHIADVSKKEEETTQQENIKLSDEVDENGRQFVLNSEGNLAFGEITEDTGLTAAPILLSEGMITNRATNDGYGLAHIEARHGEEIRKAGYKSVLDFIEQVAKNYDVIKEGNMRDGRPTYRLMLTDKHNNTLMVELSGDGTYWNINTAGIFKTSYGRRNREVYNRHTTVKQSVETTETSQDAEQSDTQAPSRMNVPTTSESEDTKSKAEGQEKSEESKETSLSEQISTASAEVDTNPTEAQKEAGNYKKGHVQVGTFDITIEQPEGSVRKGTDANGKQWESKMHNTYGYFRGTEGVDGDHIDVFLSNDIDGWNGRKVFVVDQYNPDGTFDEHKVMLGFNDVDEAKSDYLANYEKGWENGRRIDVTPVNLEDFEKWIGSSHRKTKAFAEYAGVKKEDLSASENGEGKEKVKPQEEQKPKKPKNEKGEESKADGASAKSADEQADFVVSRVKDFDNGKREETGAEEAMKKESGLSFGNGKAKRSVKLRDFIPDRRSEQQQLRGIHYDNGMAVVSDGYRLVAIRTEYPAEYEGRTLMPNGREAKGRFPNWRVVVPNVGIEIGTDWLNRVLGLQLEESDNRLVSFGGKPRATDVMVGELLRLAKLAEKISNPRLFYAQDRLLLTGDGVVCLQMLHIGIENEDVSLRDFLNGNVPSLHKAGESNMELTKAEVALRDAVIDQLRENGIDVVTDVSEGQRVLDMANGNGEETRLMSVDERKERIEQINKISPERVEDKPTTRKEARSAYMELKPVEKDGATVEFYNSAFGKAWHGEDCLFGKIIPKIREIFKSSVLAYSETDNLGGKLKPDGTIHKKHPNIKAFHNYVGKVIIGNKPYYVRFTVQEGTDAKQGTHNFFVSDISLYNNTVRNVTTDTNNTLGNTNTDGIVDAKLKNFFETSDGDGQKFSYHRVYHGSGADFEAFDHSHMGEGEGAQAYGWGTYVTEVEGIGRTYAIKNADGYSAYINAKLEYEDAQRKYNLIVSDIAELKSNLSVYERSLESSKKLIVEHGDDQQFVDNSTKVIKRAEASIAKTNAEIEAATERLQEVKTRMKSAKERLDALPKPERYFYSVEIPEDNGKNYLDWNERLSDSQIEAIRAYLSENYRRNKLEDFDASIAESKGAPNADEVNAWARRGENVYKVLSHLLGSDDAASKALSEMGFAGIKYPAENRSGGRKDGAKNYVIFNENDAKIVDKVRFFKTANGEAYGFVVGGKIYIDPRIASSETSVHEYAHLWAEALRSANAKEWSNVVGLMRGTSVWNEVSERYPELKSDDEIADEVLATYSGRRGSERLREEVDRIKGSERSVADKARALGALERVRRALDRFWHGVADFLGIHYGSADEVADRVMRDLLSGVDPRRFVKGESDGSVREQFVGEDGVSEGRGEQGRSLRGDEALTALNRIFDGEVKDELPPTIPTIEKFRQIFSKPIRTFLGELIKVKDNVYNKIQKEKRTRVSGAVMPTIKNADFAMRDTDGSTLYIKRFNNNTSDSTYNIAVVNKHGEVEDYISSVHIKRDANLRNKIKNGAELLLPNKRNGDGTVSRNNSTPDAKLGKISEKSDANGTLFRDDVDGVVSSSSGVDGMRERAVELGRELGSDVDVVSDVSEITDPNPEVQERKRRAKGWYDAKTGRVVINLAAHSDMADVEQTLLHEIVGHRGLRGLVGHENFNGFLDGVYEHASDDVRDGIDDIARRKGCSKRVATEEYMSGLAEGGFADRKNAGLWQQIRQWFSDMLSRAKIKLNFSISDNELRYLLWRSHELSRMNGREGVVGRARDLAMQNRLGVGNGVGVLSRSNNLETNVAEINNTFNRELQQQIDGKLPNGHIYRMGKPGRILLSTGVPNLPIQMSAKRLQEKATMFDHDFKLSEVKNLVLELQHPLAVFEYGDKSKAQNIIVSLQQDGKNFIVGLSLNPMVNGNNLEINSIRNVFPKDNSEWLNWIGQGKSLYLDKEKVQNLIDQQRTNLADVDYLDLDSITKVVENFENPKVSDGKRVVDSYDGDLKTLFRDADSPVDYERALIRDSYERRLKDVWFQSREALQDGMLSLKETMKDIWQSAGKKFSQITDIPDYANPYIGQNRLSSRNAAEVRDFKHNLFRPLLREVGRLTGFSADGRAKLTDYMMAKHGLERNKVMAERVAKHPNSLTCGP